MNKFEIITKAHNVIDIKIDDVSIKFLLHNFVANYDRQGETLELAFNKVHNGIAFTIPKLFSFFRLNGIDTNPDKIVQQEKVIVFTYYNIKISHTFIQEIEL